MKITGKSGILITVACVAFVGLAHAEELELTLNPRFLGEGFEPGRAKQLLEELRPLRTKKMLERQKVREELFEEITKITEPARRQFLEVAGSTEHLAQQYRRYWRRADAIFQLELEDQHKAIENLKNDYRPLFKEIFLKAKIDEEYYKKMVKNMAERSSMNKYYKGSFIIEWDEFLTFLIKWLSHEHEADDPTPETFVEVLEPPFPNTQREAGRSGHVTIDTEEGIYDVWVGVIFVGAAESLGGLGHLYTVPGEFDQAKVTAALPDTSYWLGSSSFFGAGGAYAHSTVDVLSNNEIVCSEEFDHGGIFTVVFWADSVSGADTFLVSCDFDAPGEGEEIVLSFFSTAGAWIGAVGDAYARVIATPRDLKVRLEP